MDYSEKGKLGARKFWEKFYGDETFRNKMLESWRHPNKDPLKTHRAALLGARARWKGHIKKKNGKKKMKVIIIPTDTQKNLLLKSILCGYLSGDGSLSIRREKSNPKKIHYDIGFYPDDKNMLSLFLTTFKELYRKEPKIFLEKNYYKVRITSKTACLDLIRFTKFHSLEWRIPTFVNTTELKREWLRAFFDCEAYVDKNRITIQSVNKNGIIDIRQALQEFSIESKIYQYKRRQKNWNTNYLLIIMKINSRINFLNKVGFNNLKKQIRLKRFVAGVPESG